LYGIEIAPEKSAQISVTPYAGTIYFRAPAVSTSGDGEFVLFFTMSPWGIVKLGQ
jgi:hypothetical protein